MIPGSPAPDARSPAAGWAAVVVLICFFVSGAAGLVYEVVWARYLALSLGHTSFAVVVVLAVFMGGLAIGYALIARWADRLAKPLAVYGGLEIALALYGLAFPAYYSICQAAYAKLAPGWIGFGVVPFGIKLLLGALTILLPAVLMGATLPVLTRAVTGSISELRRSVGLLYFVNSAGAIAGCALAEFWWIPAFGLKWTVNAAAALNGMAGLVALALSVACGRARAKPAAPARSIPRPDPDGIVDAPEAWRWIPVVIGLSGFVAMLYEVAWTRVLALAMGSSTHAFSLMLMSFISGIALGSLFIGAWKGPLRLVSALGWVQAAAAAAVLASMCFYEWLPFWFNLHSAWLARREETYGLYRLWQGAICLGVMFGPTLCFGMALPLAARIAAVELSVTGRAVGRVFAANTLGTVLGAVSAGFWLVPWLGLARTFALGVTINAAVGLVILGRNNRRRWAVWGALPLVTAGVWVAGLRLEATWQRAFTLGLWHDANPPRTRAQYRAALAANRLQYYRDGAAATVSVHSFQAKETEHLTLKVNGKPDASTAEDLPTQLLLGHLPMLLRPEARQVLVIGLGSGMTCGAVACHATVQAIDAVEILPEVVVAARWFAPFNGNVLANPKLRVIVDDARSYLAATAQTYDVITSEPSNPWMAGVAGVFSLEFYQSCRDHLRPGGLMVQWAHLYQTSDEALDIILTTFSSVFPHLSVFQATPWDVLLVGSLEPVRVDPSELTAQLQAPLVQADLERIQLTGAPALLVRQLVSQANGRFIAPPETRRHSDFHPALEYVAQRAFYARQQAERWRQFAENHDPRSLTWLGEFLKTRRLSLSDYQELARGHFTHGLPSARLLRSLLLRWQNDFPNSSEPAAISAQIEERGSGDQLEARQLFQIREQLFRQAESDPHLLRLYARYLIRLHRDQRSVFFLPPATELEAVVGRLLETDPKHRRDYYLLRAELAWDRGDEAACLELGAQAFDPGDSDPAPIVFPLDPQAPRGVLARMLETHWRAGRLPEALALGQAAQAAGFIGARPGAQDPLLEMTFRKVQAAAGRQ